ESSDRLSARLFPSGGLGQILYFRGPTQASKKLSRWRYRSSTTVRPTRLLPWSSALRTLTTGSRCGGQTAASGRGGRDKANWRSLAPCGRKVLSAHWFLYPA